VTVDEVGCGKCGQPHEGPPFELEPTDQPLAVEQRTGITVERVREIAALVEHGTAA
jgi:hypothetical protein